jgi:hypothetical protein
MLKKSCRIVVAINQKIDLSWKAAIIDSEQ